MVHRIDGQFLADRGRDKEKWDVRRLLAGQRECRHAVEAWDGIIRENEIKGARFKRGDKIAARIDSPGGELESCLRQR